MRTRIYKGKSPRERGSELPYTKIRADGWFGILGDGLSESEPLVPLVQVTLRLDDLGFAPRTICKLTLAEAEAFRTDLDKAIEAARRVTEDAER